MAKYIIWSIIAIAVIAGAAGCLHLYRVSARNAKEMAKYQDAVELINKNFGRVLIVYYSLSGNTRNIAERLMAKTGAEIYEIKTAQAIKTSPLFYIKARSDMKKGNYPELQGDLPNMEAYDVIFVGSPVWWYTAATPTLAFLEKADFRGRKIIPFSTQGSNAGTFLEDFTKMAKNADVSNYQSFNNIGKEYDKAVDNKISVWLNSVFP